MKIDFIITFNELDLNVKENNNIGFARKLLNGQYLRIIDQMTMIIKSIQKNVKRYDYNIICLYSDFCSEQSLTRLKDLGVIIRKEKEVFLEGRINNRVTAYKTKTDSTHSMILDCDMIFFKDLPAFDENMDLQAMYGGLHLLPIPLWEHLYNICKISKPNIDYKNFKDIIHIVEQDKHAPNKLYSPSFNNGCVLIKNTYRNQFLTDMYRFRDIITKDQKYNAHKFSKHFIEQFLLDLCILNCSKFSVLPFGVNFYPKHLDYNKYKDRVSLFHYLGKNISIDKKLVEEFL